MFSKEVRETKMNNQPKRHHILPKFYLKKFCSSNNILWVYDKIENQFREQAPINTLVKNHKNTLVDAEGNKDFRIESNFLSLYEGKAKPIIEKMERKEDIDKEERLFLSMFISLTLLRTSKFEKLYYFSKQKMMNLFGKAIFNDETNVRNILTEMEKKGRIKEAIKASELIEFHKENHSKITPHKNSYLESIVDQSIKIGKVIHNLNWTLFFAHSESSFISTDNPVIILPPNNNSNSNCGIGTQGVKTIFPLSSKLCLEMEGFEGEFYHTKELDKKSTRNFNQVIALYLDRFIFGKDKELIKRVVKTISKLSANENILK